MAKLSRVMARQANSIQDVARRLDRIERMLEALLSPDQIAAIDADLADGSEPVVANEVVVPAAGDAGAADADKPGETKPGDPSDFPSAQPGETPKNGDNPPDTSEPSEPDRRAKRKAE